MSQWYYAKDGRQNGPVGIEELKSLARSGTLSRTDLVWNQSMKDWLPAGQVDGIFDASEIPAGTSPIAGNPYAALAPVELPEIEPGSDPISVGDCVREGFELAKKHFVVLFLALLIIIGISIAASVPFSTAQGLSQLNQPQPPPPGNPADLLKTFQDEFQRDMRAQYTVVGILSQIVSLVVSSFLMAGYYRIALNVASGLPSSPGQLFGEGTKMLRILGVTVLIGIPGWIGNLAATFLDFSVGGVISSVMFLISVFLWVRFGYAGIAIVDKDLGVGESLKYSFSITRNNGWKVLGLGILSVLIVFLGMLACFVGMFFTIPVALMAVIVSYRWLRHGRAVIQLPSQRLQPPQQQ